MPQLILQPDANDGIDTLMSSADAGTNFGTHGGGLPIGSFTIAKSTIRYRVLLRFGLGAIPIVATINYAELRLSTDGLGAVSNTLFRCRRCTRNDWTELGATWNQFDGISNWTTAGGDFTTTDQASFTTAGSTVSDIVFPNLVALVSDAIVNRGGQLDLLAMVNNESGDNYIQVFSSDYTTPFLRPHLVIDYTHHLARPNYTGGMQEFSL